jgi:hypothetical protein
MCSATMIGEQLEEYERHTVKCGVRPALNLELPVKPN